MTATSADFLNWNEPEWLDYSSERWLRFSTKETRFSPFVQLYTNQVQPYHRAPHIYLGFPTRYVAGREQLTGLNRRLSESAEYFGTDYTDGGFMSSRDGRRFKFWDEAFIRPGPDHRERWVYSDNFQALGIVETGAANTRPKDLSMYVNEGVWRQCRLRRYRLRLDGFVSINASLSGGEVTTKPFTMHGKTLALNFATSAAGCIQVEIQACDGMPAPGFAIADCRELFGDEIERVVEWKVGTDVGQFAGKPIRLRFVLRDADLYSLQFRP